MRAKVSDLTTSRLPTVLGECAGNLPALCSYVNEATQRLLNAFSETGPWGCWDKVVFNISNTSPYITLPSRYARIVNMDLCRAPIRIQNSWYQVIVDGIGLRRDCDLCGPLQAYDREMVSTAVDLPATNQYLRVYLTDARDVGKRILFSGALDQNGNGIYSTSGVNQVDGFYLTLQTPFSTSAFIVTSFIAVSKDVTFGDVVLKAVDATTGVETFLARYTPEETNPSYRRYMVNGVPNCCCTTQPTCTDLSPLPQVTAMCKLEYRPVSQPSDFLIIGNIPALKAACESIRYSEIDNPSSQQFAILKWREAMKMLNQELAHYEGTEFPAIAVAMPFGNYRHDPMQVGRVF